LLSPAFKTAFSLFLSPANVKVAAAETGRVDMPVSASGSVESHK
jgi:hypothetical protein